MPREYLLIAYSCGLIPSLHSLFGSLVDSRGQTSAHKDFSNPIYLVKHSNPSLNAYIFFSAIQARAFELSCWLI